MIPLCNSNSHFTPNGIFCLGTFCLILQHIVLQRTAEISRWGQALSGNLRVSESLQLQFLLTTSINFKYWPEPKSNRNNLCQALATVTASRDCSRLGNILLKARVTAFFKKDIFYALGPSNFSFCQLLGPRWQQSQVSWTGPWAKLQQKCNVEAGKTEHTKILHSCKMHLPTRKVQAADSEKIKRRNSLLIPALMKRYFQILCWTFLCVESSEYSPIFSRWHLEKHWYFKFSWPCYSFQEGEHGMPEPHLWLS